MQSDIERVLFHRDEIARRVSQLGRDIADDLDALEDRPTEIVLIAVMTGSLVFVSDLIRHLPHKLRIGLISITSYPGKSLESRGATIRSALPGDLEGKHALIVDDILDSGATLRLVREIVSEQRPSSVWSCVLLRKQRPAALATPVEYVGFDIPDTFVVGYGLDYDDYYRNLPDIVTLRADAM